MLFNSVRKLTTDAINRGSPVKQEKLEKLAQHSRQIHFYILSLAFLLLLAVTSPGGRNVEIALAQIEHLQKAVRNWNAKFALVALGQNPYSENLKWTQTRISTPLGDGKPIPALKIEWPEYVIVSSSNGTSFEDWEFEKETTVEETPRTIRDFKGFWNKVGEWRRYIPESVVSYHAIFGLPDTLTDSELEHLVFSDPWDPHYGPYIYLFHPPISGSEQFDSYHAALRLVNRERNYDNTRVYIRLLNTSSHPIGHRLFNDYLARIGIEPILEVNFSEAFPELVELMRDMDSLSIDQSRIFLRKKRNADRQIEIFGVKIDLRQLKIWGLIAFSIGFVYFYIHFNRFSDDFAKYNEVEFDFPWIVVYSDITSRIAGLTSIVVVPVALYVSFIWFLFLPDPSWSMGASMIGCGMIIGLVAFRSFRSLRRIWNTLTLKESHET